MSRTRAAPVAQAMCGVIRQFRAVSSGLSTEGGSTESTSSPAPAICPDSSAAARSRSTTSAPRPVLIRKAPRFIPASDLPSLVTWIRAQRNPPSFGSSGTGSVGHILGEMFQRQANVTLEHVPYRGSAPLLPDLLNGQVPLAFDTMPQYVEHFAAGRLRGIAIGSAARNPMAPNVPTTAEGGMPALLAVNWMGISAPAGLPPAIVARLSAATVAALQTEIVRTRLLEHAISPTPLASAEFTAFVQRDVTEIGGMIRALGITAQ